MNTLNNALQTAQALLQQWEQASAATEQQLGHWRPLLPVAARQTQAMDKLAGDLREFELPNLRILRSRRVRRSEYWRVLWLNWTVLGLRWRRLALRARVTRRRVRLARRRLFDSVRRRAGALRPKRWHKPHR